MSTTKKSTMIAGGVIGSLVFAAILIWLFIWYAGTVIPHTYLTVYINGWWGFVHGIMIVPTFFWSLVTNDVTIYQAPNSGNWYNIGYFIGISIILGGSHGASRTQRKRKQRS